VSTARRGRRGLGGRFSPAVGVWGGTFSPKREGAGRRASLLAGWGSGLLAGRAVWQSQAFNRCGWGAGLVGRQALGAKAAFVWVGGIPDIHAVRQLI